MSASRAEKPRVKALFPLMDQNKLIVHLWDFGWDFKAFGPVTLLVGRERLSFNYTASGNQEGVPFVVLQPQEESASDLIQKAHTLFDSDTADCWVMRSSTMENV